MSQRIVIGALIIGFLIAEPRGLIALVDRLANTVLSRVRPTVPRSVQP
jgi:branched-chain amino acid transport system permease protein